jgi:hypothetical protein
MAGKTSWLLVSNQTGLRDIVQYIGSYVHTTSHLQKNNAVTQTSLSKGCHLDVVRGPSTPHDSESDAGGSLNSWQGHPSR